MSPCLSCIYTKAKKLGVTWPVRGHLWTDLPEFPLRNKKNLMSCMMSIAHLKKGWIFLQVWIENSMCWEFNGFGLIIVCWICSKHFYWACWDVNLVFGLVQLGVWIGVYDVCVDLTKSWLFLPASKAFGHRNTEQLLPTGCIFNRYMK